MKLPNFIVIGAPRAGTTALHYYLNQHPEIYMSSQKEPNFFAFEQGKLDLDYPGGEAGAKNVILHSTPTQDAYEYLFRSVTDEPAIGDVSPFYLSSPGAPQRIQRFIPEVKLIAILRDPVERAYSHYTQSARAANQDPTDFVRVLQQEEADNIWGYARFYIHQSDYFTYLSRYYQQFDPQQIKVYLYEDFQANPMAILQDIFQWLSVDRAFLPNISLKYNTSGIAKNKNLDFFLSRSNPLKPLLKKVLPPLIVSQLAEFQNRLQNRNLVDAPNLSSQDRRFLIETYFRSEILNLESLLQRDLSSWLA